jgi:tetratricopeptide (TPR) repeat protein
MGATDHQGILTMAEQSIISEDMTLKKVFQEFYRVPDYQREYVWGERNDKNEKGDEVELFLRDIHREFEEATDKSAPEYFIGTIVVCPSPDGESFDLIDGQQRTTTAYLTLCVIRDVLKERGVHIPDVLSSQIAAESMNWKSEMFHRLRLDLQYEDAGGVLQDYAEGNAKEALRTGTRSITNIGNAYDTIREFLTTQFKDDSTGVLRYYAYLTNKVKLIRIQTPSVDKALKIFETINDRGVGLDAMDLLKNLLFLHAKQESFAKLKDTWKAITDEIYSAQEKPLRFLRYFILATYDVEGQLREDDIYDWFTKNDKQTNHTKDPVAFAAGLLQAAKAYRHFVENQNTYGGHEPGLANTRSLGGRAIRQHFIFFLAARLLPKNVFSKLAVEVENLMFVWLITNTPTKDYERAIVDGAKQLRSVKDAADFDMFKTVYFDRAKKPLAEKFYDSLLRLHSYDTRAFRIKYLLAKLTQHVDLEAYGGTGARVDLAHYTDGGNDIEHILPDTPSSEALQEFGEDGPDNELIQRLGNLMLIEKSVNRALGNKRYSAKIGVYPSSQFLLVRCQSEYPKVGVNDQITKTMNSLETFPRWDRKALQRRQLRLASIALNVWGVEYANPLTVVQEPSPSEVAPL